MKKAKNIFLFLLTAVCMQSSRAVFASGTPAIGAQAVSGPQNPSSIPDLSTAIKFKEHYFKIITQKIFFDNDAFKQDGFEAAWSKMKDPERELLLFGGKGSLKDYLKDSTPSESLLINLIKVNDFHFFEQLLTCAQTDKNFMAKHGEKFFYIYYMLKSLKALFFQGGSGGSIIVSSSAGVFSNRLVKENALVHLDLTHFVAYLENMSIMKETKRSVFKVLVVLGGLAFAYKKGWMDKAYQFAKPGIDKAYQVAKPHLSNGWQNLQTLLEKLRSASSGS